MKNLFLSVFLTGIAHIGFSQNQFQFAYGGSGEELCNRLLIANNRFNLAGHTTSYGSGSYDIFLLKTDTLGNLIQSGVYGSSGEDLAFSIADAGNQNNFLCGYTTSFGSEQPFVMKVDSSGQILFSAYYDLYGWAWDIASLPDGSAVITGNTGITDTDIFLLKIDSLGQVLWVKSYGDSLINQGIKVISASDNGFLIAGYTHIQAGGPLDFTVIKTDSLGNNLWMKRYGGSGWDMAYTIAEIGTDILVAGISYTDVFNNNPNSADGLVLLLDATGAVKKSFVIGSSAFDQIRDLTVLPNGQFTIVGSTNAVGNGQTDAFIMTLDTTGTILHQTLFGGSSFEQPLSVRSVSGNNNFIVAGYTESYGGGMNDMYFLKTPAPDSNFCNQNTLNLSSAPCSVISDDVFTASVISCNYNTAAFSYLTPQISPYNICPTTNTIDVVSANDFLQIFPNPANDMLNIISSKNRIEKVEIFSISGEKILEHIIKSNSITIPVNGISPGLYFMKINFGSEFSLRKIQIIR